MLEDATLERAELGRGLEPELVERRSGVAVGGEGVRLPARPVQGDHLMGAEPLAVWMRRDERLELGRQRGVASRVEIVPDPGLESREAGVFEPGRLRLGERLVGEVGKGRPAPERERLADPVRARCGQALETVAVELARLDTHEIAGRLGHDPVGPERLSQCVDVHLERAGPARRRCLAPDPVDQPVGGDCPVRLQEELGEERTWPRPAELHGDAVVVDDLQRPQHAELHLSRPLPERS